MTILIVPTLPEFSHSQGQKPTCKRTNNVSGFEPWHDRANPASLRLLPAGLYFPHTATSGPSVVSGLTPHETLLSVRYAAAALFFPQNALITISSSRHVT